MDDLERQRILKAAQEREQSRKIDEQNRVHQEKFQKYMEDRFGGKEGLAKATAEHEARLEQQRKNDEFLRSVREGIDSRADELERKRMSNTLDEILKEAKEYELAEKAKAEDLDSTRKLKLVEEVSSGNKKRIADMTPEEFKAYRSEVSKRYSASEKGKQKKAENYRKNRETPARIPMTAEERAIARAETLKKYNESEKAKQNKAKYYIENKDILREKQNAYNKSELGRITRELNQKEYEASGKPAEMRRRYYEANKEKIYEQQNEYNNRPEIKERNKIYYREYREDPDNAIKRKKVEAEYSANRSMINHDAKVQNNAEVSARIGTPDQQIGDDAIQHQLEKSIIKQQNRYDKINKSAMEKVYEWAPETKEYMSLKNEGIPSGWQPPKDVNISVKKPSDPLGEALYRSAMKNDPDIVRPMLKNETALNIRDIYGDALNQHIVENYDPDTRFGPGDEYSWNLLKKLFEESQVPITNNIKYVKESPTGSDSLSQRGAVGTYRASDRMIKSRHPNKDNMSVRLHEGQHDRNMMNADPKTGKYFTPKSYGYAGDENVQATSKIGNNSRFKLPRSLMRTDQGIIYEQDLSRLNPEAYNKLMKDVKSGGPMSEYAKSALGMESQFDNRLYPRNEYARGLDMSEKFMQGHHKLGLFERQAFNDLVTRGAIRGIGPLADIAPIATEAVDEYAPGTARQAAEYVRQYFKNKPIPGDEMMPPEDVKVIPSNEEIQNAREFQRNPSFSDITDRYLKKKYS